MERLAGILLHPTSLPGKYGIGDFGQGAVDFINFLKCAGQGLWQVLPLSPTGFGDSPYQSFSTFAGNTLLLSPDELIKEGYLKGGFDIPEFDSSQVDYGAVIEFKERLYREAFKQFKSSGINKAAYSKFLDENSYWLNDFTLFMSIKQFFIKGRRKFGFSDEYKRFAEKVGNRFERKQIDDFFFGGSWISWPDDILNKKKKAVKKYTELLIEDIEYYSFLQYEFFRQWNNIKMLANKNGISIIGDIPIYIAYDSADCWANKKFFLLDEDGFPLEVAGVPPDYFSETGQLWGNPLYDWEAIEDDDYDWWINRVDKTREICDYLRIDHFRAFDTYWSVPFGEKTAVNGQWKNGPADSFFEAISRLPGELNIIAEDLGAPAQSVIDLRDRLKLPGMKVLQFAFDSDNTNLYLPHNFDDTNCVVYTGTHDNDTTVGWYSDAPAGSKHFARSYMNTEGISIAWDFIRLAYSSTAAFAIIPLQDCLSLGRHARMNKPGVTFGNWRWRYTAGMLKGEVTGGLKYLADMFSRSADGRRKD